MDQEMQGMTLSTIRMRGGRRLLFTMAVVCAALVALMFASSAQADFGVREFGGEVAQQDGSPATQAGSHPYRATVNIEFNTHAGPTDGVEIADADVKDIEVDLPPGFIGNPNAAPKCDERDLQTSLELACPAATQVGLAVHRLASWGLFYAKVYNMVPPEGVPAQFAMQAAGVVIHLNAKVRSNGDYGLTVVVPNVSQKVSILGTSMTFWGVPGDPSHDSERGQCVGATGPTGGLCPTDAPTKAFLTNPMHCTDSTLSTVIRASPWNNPSQIATASFDHDVNDIPMKVEGCDRVPFDGSLSAKPLSRVAGAPSAYEFDVDLPRNDNPNGLDISTLRKVVTRLPLGMSVNPSSADGLEGCDDVQFGRTSLADAQCPEASKIGTLRITTPLLDVPLTGDIILGRPLPNQLLRLFLVARGAGVTVKLAGDVTPDPVTGQLTATFDNNPQLPFTNLHLEFKGGPRAALSNPPVQGTYTTTTELTSWSGKTVTSNSTFAITEGAKALGFTPDFAAGTISPQAGTSSPFALSFGRGDDDQRLKDIVVSLQQGITGAIASRDLCSAGLAAAGTCAEASRIGSTTTGAGAGTNPFYLPGRVYITGPYKGAPFGLSIVVPAIAGPFDLGTVVVRAAIFVDKETAALRIASEPLPTILQGIPLQIRDVRVNIDRPGFMINPTNCAPGRIDAQIGSADGASAAARSRFQVTNCGQLPYRPKMKLQVGARGRTSDGMTTPFAVTLSMTPGQANNKSVQVTLPKTLNSRLRVINDACKLEEFKAGASACKSVGTAVAVTPLLRDPLRGNAYFVRNPARRIPDLMVALKGQVDIDLTGKVTIPRDLTLRTTFDTVPDVPITKFTMRFVAGRRAPIGIVTNLCTPRGRAGRARLAFRSQGGRLRAYEQKLSIVGCAKARRAAKR